MIGKTALPFIESTCEGVMSTMLGVREVSADAHLTALRAANAKKRLHAAPRKHTHSFVLFGNCPPRDWNPRFLQEHQKCYNGVMNDANRQIVRKSTLAEQGTENDFRDATVAERWDAMWQMTVDCWAMKGIDIAEQEFQRHVECLKRLHDD
jgi:hypothetical protein